MPFDKLETITKNNMQPTARVTYLRGIRNGVEKKGVKPKLVISVPSVICGTAKAKTFELSLGTGDDAGKIRISGCKSEMTGIAPTELKHAFVFRFGFVPRLGNDIFDGGRCAVRKISDDEFEIDFPAEWFDNNVEEA